MSYILDDPIFLWESNNDISDGNRGLGDWHLVRQRRKAFYKHERAHPRLNYTERQKEYIEKNAERVRR